MTSSAPSQPLRLWSLLLLLLGSGAAANPLPSQLQLPDQPQQVLGLAPAASPRRLTGKFLHITDFHPDAFYKVHSSTSAEAACHRGKGVAGTYGAETSDCDTPYSLINATFDWIADNIRDDIDFVIWTGDNARHDSDEKIPRSFPQVFGSNQIIADKFVSLFDDPSGQGMRIPVVPTLGNNDILPHNVLLPGPNKVLKRFTDIWGRFIPQEQRHSFEFGGWFYVEVIPNHLAVFSINTLYFFDRNAGIDDCVNPSEPGFKQFEWLRVQLQFMRERGVKAILMGHVPPARTTGKQLWDETCWQKYTLWLRQYRDVIIGAFYGHMNVDHFLLQDTKDINYALVGAVDEDGDEDADGGDSTALTVRTAMEDELSVQSAADYLQELRDVWSKLPKPSALQAAEDDESEDDESEDLGDADADKKKKKKKSKGPKLSRKWAERYQLTFVGPSIVPNFLPTLRVVEYNITGLEDAPVWTDGPSSVPVLPDDGSLFDSETDEDGTKNGKKGKKSKKGKGKKGKKPAKDPNLVVPDGPAKTAVPGPAYSPQPLAFLGYTQYYANLTFINNDMEGVTTDDENADSTKWREGKHSDKEPKAKPAKPHPFEYTVEYSTFTDKLYKLSDLTVNSFVKLAYRMGKKAGGKLAQAAVTVDNDGDKDVDDVDDMDGVDAIDDFDVVSGDDDDDNDDDDLDFDEAAEKSGKKKKKNKTWLHFLRHAFVTTVDKKQLKKMG